MVYSLELVYGGMATWELVLCPQRVDTMTVISFLVSGGKFGEALCISTRWKKRCRNFIVGMTIFCKQYLINNPRFLDFPSCFYETVWPLRPDVWEMFFYKETMETLSCWATGTERWRIMIMTLCRCRLDSLLSGQVSYSQESLLSWSSKAVFPPWPLSPTMSLRNVYFTLLLTHHLALQRVFILETF